MKAAGLDTSKQEACNLDRTEIKETITSSTGVDEVSDEMADAFVLEGASNKISETVVLLKCGWYK